MVLETFTQVFKFVLLLYLNVRTFMRFSSSALIYVRNNYQVFFSVFFSLANFVNFLDQKIGKKIFFKI
jgi:hypothetical protein